MNPSAPFSRSEVVSGALDICHRQLAENRADAAAVFRQLANVIVISAAVRKSFFEDGRIGGHALQAVLLDHALKFAARQKFAAQKIEPERLTELFQFLQ